MITQNLHGIDIEWMIKRRKMFDDFYQQENEISKYYLVAEMTEPVNKLNIRFFSRHSDKKILKEKKARGRDE